MTRTTVSYMIRHGEFYSQPETCWRSRLKLPNSYVVWVSLPITSTPRYAAGLMLDDCNIVNRIICLQRAFDPTLTWYSWHPITLLRGDLSPRIGDRNAKQTL